MSTDAINTGGETVGFPYPPWVTLLGDASGNIPNASGEQFDFYAVRVVQSASGSRLDYADLEWVLTENLTNREQPANFTRMVAVNLPDSLDTRIHLGDYVDEVERVDQDGETLRAQSQMRDYHFGSPCRGYTVYNPMTSTQETVQSDVFFNPEIDGKTWGNRSDNTRGSGSSHIWLHPDTGNTVAGLNYHDTAENEWTMQEAVESLCELMNSSEDYILNPSSFTALADAPEIRSVRIPIGTRLHQALDTLLIPYGYNWYLDYDAGTTKPRITLFDVGAGDEKSLYFQQPGEDLDLAFSNTNQFEVSRSIGDSFNAVRVLGDYEAYEVTLPLWPMWDDASSADSVEDLNKDAATYEGKENVWRLWVANESGEYDESVDCLGQLPVVPILSDVFTLYVPHRRRIEEPLTYLGGADSESRRPLFVQYSTDAGTTWMELEDGWSVKLLPDQIGILFDGKDVPQELYDAGEDARMRITGTIYGDSRIEGFADKLSYAVNGRYIEQVYNMPEKFQFRKRNETGDYASALAGTVNEADEVDDSTEIQTYAVKLRNKNLHAEVNAEFRLPGWHLEYKIGDLITNISGREINLDAASSTSPTHRYPQIVERRFEYNPAAGPSTVLIVDRGVSPYINLVRGMDSDGGRLSYAKDTK